MVGSAAITLITGPPGSGKSGCCLRRVEEAREQGVEVAGVLSPGRYLGGRKVGIDVVNLRSGERRSLASLRSEGSEMRADPALLTAQWRFDEQAVTWANGVLQRATPCDLLVVDELGPFEWLRNQGWVAGIEAVSSREYHSALVVVRPGLVHLARARWAGATLLECGPPARGSSPPD